MTRWCERLSFYILIIAGLMATLAPCCVAAEDSKAPEPAKTKRFLVSGGPDVLWVVRTGLGEKGGKFDMTIRSPGGKWRTLPRFSGFPDAIAAGDKRLHLVTGGSTPNTTVISLSGDEKNLMPDASPGAKWPAGTDSPSAICPIGPLGKSISPGFLAVVPTQQDLLSTPKSTSQPARKKSRLVLFQTLNGQWELVDKIDDIVVQPEARVSAAASEDRVYILVANKDIPHRLIAWGRTNGKNSWKEVTLPPGDGKPLSVNAVRGRVVLVSMVQTPDSADSPAPSSQPGKTGVCLEIRELQRDTLAPDSQSVKYKKKPLTLSGEAPPSICTLGQPAESQLVLIWREGEDYRCAIADLNGQVVENKKVAELTRKAPSFDTRKILDYFLIAIPFVLLGFILFGRQGNPVGPVILPVRVTPGSLPKRALALFIDSIPFSILGSVATRIVRPDLTFEDISNHATTLAEQRDTPIELLICMLSSLLVWAVYGAVMEARFGATLGKMAMRLEVISIDARRPTVRQAVLRNLIRPIEVISWPILIFTLAMSMLTQTRQRLGDLMARTVVIEKARTPILEPGDEDQEPKPDPPAGEG